MKRKKHKKRRKEAKDKEPLAEAHPGPQLPAELIEHALSFLPVVGDMHVIMRSTHRCHGPCTAFWRTDRPGPLRYLHGPLARSGLGFCKHVGAPLLMRSECAGLVRCELT